MPPRREAPPGMVNATQAMEILGNKMLYRYIEMGLIHPQGPPHRKHKYYLLSEIEAIHTSDTAFYGESSAHPLEAPTMPATQKDLLPTHTITLPVRAALRTRESHQEHTQSDLTRMIEEDLQEDTLPPGTLTLAQFADLLGIRRTSFLGQVKTQLANKNIAFEHIQRPIPGRPKEKERLFTPEQQDTIKNWRAAHPSGR